MQTVDYAPAASSPMSAAPWADPELLAQYQILRRNGSVVAFEPSKIAVAMMKAFLAVHGTQGAASSGVRDTVEELTAAVVRALMRSRPGGGTFHIEDVQDQVELGLMRSGNHEVARSYVLYRERRTQERAAAGQTTASVATSGLHVLDGSERRPLNEARLLALISSACAGLGNDVRPEPIAAETLRNIYDGIPLVEVHKASILAARTLIEKDPSYTYATARLLLHTIRREVMGRDISQDEMALEYPAYFSAYIAKGIGADLLDEKLGQFDLQRLGAALQPERDLQFDYLGLQTLYDRYFIHIKKQRIEMPQAFFMRVAMGLALNEQDREARALRVHVGQEPRVRRPRLGAHPLEARDEHLVEEPRGAEELLSGALGGGRHVGVLGGSLRSPGLRRAGRGLRAVHAMVVGRPTVTCQHS